MRRPAIIGAFLVAAGLSSPAGSVAAQDPDVVRLERPDRLMRIVLDRRARLGIKVNLRARDTDSIGASVDAVTPGGPADQAGIRSGDIITRLDGKSVLAGGAAEDTGRRGIDGEGRTSLPGLRLIELAARLEPNDTVSVDYRRGKERRTASVVTADEPNLAERFRFDYRGPEGVARAVVPAGEFLERFEMAGPHWQFFSGSPLGRLELAPLNSDLGRYFGTEEGVLVVSAPEDSALGLRGGDVVQRVDGREASSPSRLLRILRSYEPGETFRMDIVRDGKKETVTARIGERTP